MGFLNIIVPFISIMLMVMICKATPVHSRDRRNANNQECPFTGSLQIAQNITQTTHRCTGGSCDTHPGTHHRHQSLASHIPETSQCYNHNSTDVPPGNHDNTGCTHTWEFDDNPLRIPKRIWHPVCSCNSGCSIEYNCEPVYQEMKVLWRKQCLRYGDEPVYEYEWRTQNVAYRCACKSILAKSSGT
ncbi:uncharacterized protein [Amphiura filiformis]|uniref:uncharacterized protein n=1 Tax=Amphiura filiformis TaxID=82378 RepID=UPI003B21660C